MKKKPIFWIILLCFIVGFFEVGSYISVTIVRKILIDAKTSNIFLSDDHTFTQEDIDRYFDVRDSVLGWPTSTALQSDRYDESAARNNPAHPYPRPACVAAFGDSFIYSAEVSDADAWSNRLSMSLGCRVANFGVGGYGTDQAYMRFKRTNIDPAFVVVLGLFPENIQRNVNQYRGFLVAKHVLAFKPRYVVRNGKLLLLPIIQQENFDYDELLKEPRKFLESEFFLPESSFGPVRVRFPYSFTAIKALLHPKVLSFLFGQPTWAKLYQRDSGSDGFEVTAAILRQFTIDVRNLGKTPIVFVFTNVKSVENFVRSGIWPYQSILNFMDQEDIQYIHFGEYLNDSFDLSRICEIFTKQILFGCAGHYTKEGYRMVADAIYRFIKGNSLLRNSGS